MDKRSCDLEHIDILDQSIEAFSGLNDDRYKACNSSLQQLANVLKMSSEKFDNYVNSPGMRQFFDELKTTFSHYDSIIKNDSVNLMISVCNQISSLISSIKEPLISEVTLAHMKYIELLKQLKWPLFLINDEGFITKIKAAYEESIDSHKILHIVAEYCNRQYMQQVLSNWLSSTAIKEGRIPILKEAVSLHNRGNFFASTSILMCQIYGIASDIVTLSERNGLVADMSGKELIINNYCIDGNSINREKGRLIQAILFANRGVFVWDAFAYYLTSEILCSSKSEESWATQPLRNKICHGEQLNYGTFEHSIKAILCIDLLILLANEMERIVQKEREKV